MTVCENIFRVPAWVTGTLLLLLTNGGVGTSVSGSLLFGQCILEFLQFQATPGAPTASGQKQKHDENRDLRWVGGKKTFLL